MTPSPATGFPDRHIGPDPDDVRRMLAAVGQESLEGLVEAVMPAAIRSLERLDLPAAAGEREVLAELAELAARKLG